MAGRADALLKCCVPNSVSRAFISSFTVLSIESVATFALANQRVSVPLLAVDALQAHCAVEVKPGWADAVRAGPDLSTKAGRVGAGVSVPDIIIRADASIVAAEDLASFTNRNIDASGSSFVLIVWALATVSIHIPNLSGGAFRDLGTGESIPPQR